MASIGENNQPNKKEWEVCTLAYISSLNLHDRSYTPDTILIYIQG